MRPHVDKTRIEFKNAVMNQKEDAQNDDLETIHKGVAEQQRRSLTLHKQTDKQLWRTPEEVVVKEKEAAAGRHFTEEG